MWVVTWIDDVQHSTTVPYTAALTSLTNQLKARKIAFAVYTVQVFTEKVFGYARPSASLIFHSRYIPPERKK